MGVKEPWIRDRRRRLKFERQGGRCWWCGGAMTLVNGAHGEVPANFATFEHLVRRCDGGSGLPHNVVLACKVCNNERHGKDTVPAAMPTSGTGWELV